MASSELYDIFHKHYPAYKVDVKYEHQDVNFGPYFAPQRVSMGSTVEMTMDGEVFKRMLQSLYEVHEDEKIRKKSAAVQRAYDQYKMLLEISRE